MKIRDVSATANAALEMTTGIQARNVLVTPHVYRTGGNELTDPGSLVVEKTLGREFEPPHGCGTSDGPLRPLLPAEDMPGCQRVPMDAEDSPQRSDRTFRPREYLHPREAPAVNSRRRLLNLRAGT